jgi:hypothetical protein
VRRLYSTFAQGPPGLGLLLLRLVAGIGGIVLGFNALRSAHGVVATLFHVLWLGLSSLLIVGLWTPLVGTLLALTSIWHALTHVEDRWYCVVVGALGVALALLGPGLWSVDARLFGWRRVEISARRQPGPPP